MLPCLLSSRKWIPLRSNACTIIIIDVQNFPLIFTSYNFLRRGEETPLSTSFDFLFLTYFSFHFLHNSKLPKYFPIYPQPVCIVWPLSYCLELSSTLSMEYGFGGTCWKETSNFKGWEPTKLTNIANPATSTTVATNANIWKIILHLTVRLRVP